MELVIAGLIVAAIAVFVFLKPSSKEQTPAKLFPDSPPPTPAVPSEPEAADDARPTRPTREEWFLAEERAQSRPAPKAKPKKAKAKPKKPKMQTSRPRRRRSTNK